MLENAPVGEGTCCSRDGIGSARTASLGDWMEGRGGGGRGASSAAYPRASSLSHRRRHRLLRPLESLSGLGAQAEFQQEIRAAIPMVVESLKDSNWNVRRAALEFLSDLGAQAVFQQEIRAAIPMVVESLKDSKSYVRSAALESLSGLGAQAEFQQEIRAAIPMVVESLKDSKSCVRSAALESLSVFGAEAEFQQGWNRRSDTTKRPGVCARTVS
ncbi:armadillo-type protein [Mycena latifolia]|nr:armadillo-type protein [Mycena latifolia]